MHSESVVVVNNCKTPAYIERLCKTFACYSCMSKAARVLTTIAQQLQNCPGIVTPVHSAGGLRCSAIACRMLSTNESSDRTEIGQPGEEDQNTGEHAQPGFESRPPPPFPEPTPPLPLGLGIRLRHPLSRRMPRPSGPWKHDIWQSGEMLIAKRPPPKYIGRCDGQHTSCCVPGCNVKQGITTSATSRVGGTGMCGRSSWR